MKNLWTDLKALNVVVKVSPGSQTEISEVSILLTNGEFILHFTDDLTRRNYGKIDHPYVPLRIPTNSLTFEEIWEEALRAQDEPDPTEKRVRSLLALLEFSFSGKKSDRENIQEYIESLLEVVEKQ